MYHLHLYKKTLNNITLKCVSFILGYSLWYLCSTTITVEKQLMMPLTFFNTQYNTITSDHEQVYVTLQGTKHTLAQLNPTNMAVHINEQTLHHGENHVRIDDRHIFLPPSVKLVHCKPYVLTLHVTS